MSPRVWEKKDGGLGIKRFPILNRILLAKWLRRVIRGRFGELDGEWSRLQMRSI